MGRKKVSQPLNRQIVNLRQELTATVKSIDRYRPYLRDVIICAQHLWIMSNQYLLTEENLQDESKTPEILKHICAIREFHEKVLRMDIGLVGIRTRISQEFLRELRTINSAVAISGIFSETVIPILTNVNADLAMSLRPLKEIQMCYGEKIKETLGENFYASMDALLSDTADRQMLSETNDNPLDDDYDFIHTEKSNDTSAASLLQATIETSQPEQPCDLVPELNDQVNPKIKNNDHAPSVN